jgi:transcriptional regulator with XRE-family HTH domain
VKRNEQAEREVLKRRLRQAIAESGKLLRQVAEDTGASTWMITSYLNGIRLPGCLTLARIADATGVRTDWLLGLTDNKGGRG